MFSIRKSSPGFGRLPKRRCCGALLGWCFHSLPREKWYLPESLFSLQWQWIAQGAGWPRRSFGITVCSQRWYNCRCAGSYGGAVDLEAWVSQSSQPERPRQHSACLSAAIAGAEPRGSSTGTDAKWQLGMSRSPMSCQGHSPCHPVTQHLLPSSSKRMWCRGIR